LGRRARALAARQTSQTAWIRNRIVSS
jgi:hypothetical protein